MVGPHAPRSVPTPRWNQRGTAIVNENKRRVNVETQRNVRVCRTLSVVPFGPLWKPACGGWGAHANARGIWAALLPTVAQLFQPGREKYVSLFARTCFAGRGFSWRKSIGVSLSRRLSRRPKTPSETSNGGVSLPLFLRTEFKQDSSGTGRADPLWANAPKLGRPSGLRRYDIIHEKLNRHRAYRERAREREGESCTATQSLVARPTTWISSCRYIQGVL